MGQKYKKKQLLSEIDQKILSCRLYQETDPDQLAKSRVQTLDKNPCNDGMYYTVITYKGAVQTQSSDQADLLTQKRTGNKIFSKDKSKNFYNTGCIIQYDLKNNKISSITEYSQFSALISNLISHCSQSDVLIKALKPTSASILNSFMTLSCLKDDYDSCKQKYSKIYYAMGNFKAGIDVQDELENAEIFDSEKETLYKYSYKFSQVSYVNLKKKSSLQKNINEEIGGSASKISILNNVTQYQKKSEKPIVHFDSYVFDIGDYVANTLRVIETSDNSILSIYKKKSQSAAKFEMYQALGGSKSDAKNWSQLSNQFAQFKAMTNDKKLYESLLKNKGDQFMKNMAAYQKTNYIFMNNDDCIKYLYNDYIQLSDVPGQIKKLDSLSLLSHFCDPKHFYVQSSGNDNIEFNKQPSYKITIPVDASQNISNSVKTGKQFSFLTDPDKELIQVTFNFTSTNTQGVQRQKINIGVSKMQKSYKLTSIDLETDVDVKNEITEDTQKKYPANSYYSDIKDNESYFSTSQLIDRLSLVEINYEIVPKQVTKSVKTFCAESSQWKQNCQQVLQKYKDKYQSVDLLLRATVDTISYDPWEKLIDELMELYNRFAQLSADKNGYVQESPFANDLEKLASTTCKKCGKTKDQCQCQELKLCDKVYPLDFFGVTGLLGLQETLSKLGVFNATAYILDQNGNLLSYKEINNYFKKLCGVSDIGGIDFKNNAAIKRQKNLGIGSVADQFDQQQFKDFVQSYNKLFKDNAKDVIKLQQSLNDKYTKKIKIGVADGYSYIPVGQQIAFQHSISDPTNLTIKGCDKQLSMKLFQMTQLNGMEYVEAAQKLQKQGITDKATGKKSDLPENAKKFLAYPYKPNILAILGQQNEDTDPQLDSYAFAYYYIPRADSVSQLIKNFGKSVNVLTFDIYMKQPIKCGFPKKDQAKCKKGGVNGKCGLEQLFKNPICVHQAKFNLQKQLQKMKTRTISSIIQKSTKSLVQNFNKIVNFACDVDGNLKAISQAKDQALDVLYTLGSQLSPILNLFPLKCLVDAANDGRNAICSASRQAHDKSIIQDVDDSFSHKFRTVKIVAGEAWDSTKNRFNMITSGFINPIGGVAKASKQLWDNASIYTMCPQRFNDYIDQSGIVKSFGEGLTQLMQLDILTMLKGILGTCLVDGIIDSALGGVNGISQNQLGQLKRVLQNGDVQAFKQLGTKYPELLEKFGSSGGQGIDFQKVVNASQFNTQFMSSFNSEITKRLAPDSMVSLAKDKFTDPNNLINFVKDGAKSAITGGPTGLTNSLMSNITGAGLDAAQGQLGANLSNIFGSSAPKNNIEGDVLQSVNQFIKDKNDLYNRITKSE